MKIIELCDVNAKGHTVRLADGSYRLIPHSTGETQIGADIDDADGIKVLHGHTTVEQMNSPAQVLGNVLSEIVQPHDDIPQPPGGDKLPQSAASGTGASAVSKSDGAVPKKETT